MPNRFNDRENGESSYFPRGYTGRHREDQDFGTSSQRRFGSSSRAHEASERHIYRNQDPEVSYGYTGVEDPRDVNNINYKERPNRGDERFQRPRHNADYEDAQQRFTGSAEQGWYRDQNFGAGIRHSQYEQGPYFGKGPKGYRRSDQRIEEDINERLTQHPFIDATEIVVSVQNGEVQLSGTVENRDAKHMAEDIAESVSGVKDVHNRIRVNRNNNPIR